MRRSEIAVLQTGQVDKDAIERVRRRYYGCKADLTRTSGTATQMTARREKDLLVAVQTHNTA